MPIYEVISLGVPAALLIVLLLETFSPRVAAKLPDMRKATAERLKLLKERGDQRTHWAWLEDVLRSYKIDDVPWALPVAPHPILLALRTRNPVMGAPGGQCLLGWFRRGRPL